MSLAQSQPTVDVNIPRFNQAVVAASIAIAFVANAPWLVAAVAAMLIAPLLLGPRASLTARIYEAVVRERIDPEGPSEVEDARPPRFASLLGAVFTSSASLAFLAGLPGLGWALAGLVGALALLAATSRICVGCVIYRGVTR